MQPRRTLLSPARWSALAALAFGLSGCPSEQAATDAAVAHDHESADAVADAPRLDAGADVASDAAVDAGAPADVRPDTSPADAVNVDAVTVDTAAVDVVRVDVAMADVSPADTGSACTGTAPSCASGTPGGVCSDVVTVATCVGGAWRCGEGMIPLSECGCAGRPPGADCSCVSGMWRCGGADAGLLNCDPRTAACDALPPPCMGGGEVREVRGGCWGACVTYDRCAPISCNPDGPASQCPTNTVCFRTTRLCGLPVT